MIVSFEGEGTEGLTEVEQPCLGCSLAEEEQGKWSSISVTVFRGQSCPSLLPSPPSATSAIG